MKLSNIWSPRRENDLLNIHIWEIFRDRPVSGITAFSRCKRSQCSQSLKRKYGNQPPSTGWDTLEQAHRKQTTWAVCCCENWSQKSKRKFQVCTSRREIGCQMLQVRGTEVQEVVCRLVHRCLWNRLSRSVGRNCFMFGFREGPSVGFVRLMPEHLFQLTLRRYTAKIAQKSAVVVKATDRFLKHSPCSLLEMTSADSCYGKTGFALF